MEANANAQQMQQLQVDLHNQQNMGQAQQQATIGMQSLQQAMQGGQVPAEWQHGRVQLLPQTIPGSYIPQVYGQHLVMPNNILHPGLGQHQQIQLVASNCKFQGGQLGPQMLTTNAQGKQVLSGTAGNFSTYTLPTIPSSQAQTLLFSPVGVISSQQQQQNILPQLAQQQQQQQQVNQQSQHQQGNQTGQQQNNSGNSNPATPVKSEQDMQKNLSGQKILQKMGGNCSTPGTPTNNAQQCVQVPQTMQAAQIISPIQQANPQFAPWLSNVTPQLWPPFVQNGIIFRGTQPDSQNMFIQHNPQGGGQPQVLQTNSTITLPCNMVTQAQQQQQQQQAQSVTVSQASQVTGAQNAHAGQAIALNNTVVTAPNSNKVRIAGAGEIAPKQLGRGPSILPQQSGGGMNAIRPALSVSTQTAQNQSLLKQSKLRAKPSPVRAINPQSLKPQDVIVSASPMGVKQQQSQQISTAGLQMPQMHQVVTSMGNK